MDRFDKFSDLPRDDAVEMPPIVVNKNETSITHTMLFAVWLAHRH